MHQRSLASGIVALAAAAAIPMAPLPLFPQRADPARVAAAVDSLVAGRVEAGQLAGAVVLVERKGETLLARGYGRAELENEVRMTPEHVFPIASVTKQFTAAAVLALAEGGKLRLDEPITTYLPDAPTQGRRITVRQLLAHTSGMQDVTEMPGFRSVERLDLSPDSTLSLVRDAPLHFAPGEQMRYSNSGYLLLGRLIETVSGQSYEEYLAEHLFGPAGMRATRYCDPRALIPRRASGYELSPEGLVRSRFVSLRLPFSAGGICSMAADLAAWSRALYGGRILGPAMLAEMVRPGELTSGRRTRYGLGLAVGSLGGHLAYHHGGDIQGFTTYTAYFPGDSLSVVVLYNTQGPARPDALVERIAELVPGHGEAPAPSTPPPALAAFAGRYGEGVTVTVEREGLRLTGGPHGDFDLRFVEGTTFQGGGGLYTFGPAEAEGGGMALWADLTWAVVRWDRR